MKRLKKIADMPYGNLPDQFADQVRKTNITMNDIDEFLNYKYNGRNRYILEDQELLDSFISELEDKGYIVEL